MLNVFLFYRTVVILAQAGILMEQLIDPMHLLPA